MVADFAELAGLIASRGPILGIGLAAAIADISEKSVYRRQARGTLTTYIFRGWRLVATRELFGNS